MMYDAQEEQSTQRPVPELFGSLVFNDDAMRSRVPKEIYQAFCKAKEEGLPLDETVAGSIANAMKGWAVEHGATHYTHWFQPMTGVTAGKHDSFITPVDENKVIMEFSGKELIKGESDASSFPSGGLRATFEARGYTSWDPTSPAFLKDGSLCIPTSFCSFGGEALDRKTPLLRSINALNRHALRILRLFGDTETTRVIPTVGAEQEYFLIDRKMYEQRKDLMYTGRTLLGAKPPKGQELEDHYFGVIKPRVSAYMKDLDQELWKLGILSKTKHNEAAPGQHELAPLFTTSNIATDHNQLTMEVMKQVASRHGLACLLHEKPFAGVNGSGKHNNWSLSTDKGRNLLDPGDFPQENQQFLLFLCAIIRAVDEYQDLLRISVACAGNDHRLGAGEAPPAIISIFLGEELTNIFHCLVEDHIYGAPDTTYMETSMHSRFVKDTTDRNRTSPFAFTGNKFEFRMLGSSLSVSSPNFILNTAMAEVLDGFATELENAPEFAPALRRLMQETIRKHGRIIFNGNNYSKEWVEEAKKRGLLNLPSTADAAPYYIHEKNLRLMEKHGVLSRIEMASRYEVTLENYTKQLHIEGLTMVDMIHKDILPAVCSYMKDLSQTACSKKQISPQISCQWEETLLSRLSRLSDSLAVRVGTLENALEKSGMVEGAQQRGRYYRDVVFNEMEATRAVADEIESLVGERYWPYPTYGKLLFSVK